MKKSSQKEVWNAIANNWSEFRQTPSPTVVDFLNEAHGNVLDLGCGSGRNFMKTKKMICNSSFLGDRNSKESSKNFCIKKGKLYGLDFSEKMIELAKKDAKKKKLDIELQVMDKKIPYDDNFFDNAICAAVLHCLNKKEQKVMVDELYRVLKKGGRALVSVWGKKSPRLRNAGKESYVGWKTGETKQLRYTYLYDLEELKEQLKKAGFKIIESWEERNANVVVEKS